MFIKMLSKLVFLLQVPKHYNRSFTYFLLLNTNDDTLKSVSPPVGLVNNRIP